MSDDVCICPCACQSINRINRDLFSLFRNFQHPNWRNVSRRQSQVLKRQIQVGLQVMYFKGHIASQSFALVQYFTQSSDSVLSWVFQKV
jgi:hypothetical protein